MVSIDEYNNRIGEAYAKHPDLFKFSPCFSRCEGLSFTYATYLGNKRHINTNYIYLLVIFLAKILRDLFFISLTKTAKLNKVTKDTILVFSYFDERSNESGSLREEYFREILANEQEVLCVYKFISPGFISRGVKYTKLLSRLKKNYTAYSEHAFIDITSILKAIFKTIRHFFEFIKIKDNLGLEDTLTAILIKGHIKEILNGVVYQHYLQELIFNKILSKQPKLILYVWENQPWNRILETSKKRLSPKTISKGFQHTGFCKKLLQHYPSESEGLLDSYPDQIICNGKINQAELKKYYSNVDVIVGSALRQNHLLRRDNSIPKLLDSSSLSNIAFAFSWDQTNYDRIISELKDIPSSIRIYLKFHPNYPDWLKRSDFPDNFINSTLSWEELSKTCPLVLVNDNSVMFEGYFYGMHTAIYDLSDDMGLDKRDFNSPIPHLVRNDLKDIDKNYLIEKINQGTEKVFSNKYLEDYFVNRSIKESKEIFYGD